jgi:hypothetical protein
MIIMGKTNEINTLDAKFHTLSDKYKLVKTSDMIEKLEGQGFKLESFVANKVKKKERQGFQKHRAIFSHPSLLKSSHDDGVPQLILTNSHDGTSAVILQLGFFRLVCSNGLIIGKTIGEPIALRHSGKYLYEELDRAVEKIAAQVATLDEAITKMKLKTMTSNEIKELQRQSIDSRLLDGEKLLEVSMRVNRSEDSELDLFTVMNVIQENLIRGGAVLTVERENKTKQKTLRAVNSIHTQTKINTAVWDNAFKLVA